jgi:hypothetical protein
MIMEEEASKQATEPSNRREDERGLAKDEQACAQLHIDDL